MRQYLDSLSHVLEHGEQREDRTGVGTIGVFGLQNRYDLRKGFPAVTTKKLAWKAVISELLWFIEGSSDERRLAEILHGTRDVNKTTIWSANAKDWGNEDLGRIYGKQWRSWNTVSGEIDQLERLISDIKTNPYGRRHILSAWNPGELNEMALPPCHILSQFYVNKNNELSCQMYQRSADMFLGVPFNIASYSLLTHMIAQVCNLKVGEFVHTIGDAHIYTNHTEQVKEQLNRTPFHLPVLKMNTSIKNIGDFSMNDFELINYQSHSQIKAEMAV